MLPLYLLFLGLPALVGFLSDKPVNISFFSQIYTLGVVERKALDAAPDDFAQWLDEPGGTALALSGDPLTTFDKTQPLGDMLLFFYLAWFTMALLLLFSLRRSNAGHKLESGAHKTVYNTVNYIMMDPGARPSSMPPSSAGSAPRMPRRARTSQSQSTRFTVPETTDDNVEVEADRHEQHAVRRTSFATRQSIGYVNLDEDAIPATEPAPPRGENTIAPREDVATPVDTHVNDAEPAVGPAQSPVLDATALAERSRELHKRVRRALWKKRSTPRLDEDENYDAESSNMSSGHVEPDQESTSRLEVSAIIEGPMDTPVNLGGPCASSSTQRTDLVGSGSFEISRVLDQLDWEESDSSESYRFADQPGTPSQDVSPLSQPHDQEDSGSAVVSNSVETFDLDSSAAGPFETGSSNMANVSLDPASLRTLLAFDEQRTYGLFPKMNLLGPLGLDNVVANIRQESVPELPAIANSEPAPLDSAVIEHGPILRLVDAPPILSGFPQTAYAVNTPCPPDVIVSPATPQAFAEEPACPDWPPCPPSPSELPNPYGSNSSDADDEEDDELEFQSNAYKAAPRFPPVFERPERPASPEDWRARPDRPRVARAAWNFVSSWIRRGDEQSDE